MRLSEYEKDVIIASAKDKFGEDTKVTLFGSRADNNRRGGDIDLLIRPGIQSTPEYLLKKKIEMQIEIERKLGEQKIDIILQQPGDKRSIINTATETGIDIC